ESVIRAPMFSADVPTVRMRIGVVGLAKRHEPVVAEWIANRLEVEDQRLAERLVVRDAEPEAVAVVHPFPIEERDRDRFALIVRRTEAQTRDLSAFDA